MNNLYELNQNYKELSEVLDERLANGEEVEDYLIDTLDAIADAREVKFDNIANWIERNENDIEFYDKKIKELQQAKKILKNKNTSLMRYLTTSIDEAGLKEVRTDNHILKPRNYKASVKVDDIMALPEEYRFEEVKTEWKKDTKALYNDLKQGKEIKGARLEPNRKVVIK